MITKKKHEKLIKENRMLKEENRMLKEENDFFKRGWKAMTVCLNYHDSIVAIMNTIGLKEIEIDSREFVKAEKYFLEAMDTIDFKKVIRLKPFKEMEEKDESK